MELDTPVAPATPDLIPEAPPEPTAEETSVASHAAAFDPKRPPVSQTPEPQATPSAVPEPTEKPSQRHRAQSQKAGPADVPRINELTRKLREAEAELARFRSTPAPTPSTDAPKPPIVAAAAKPVEAPVSGFTEPEPVLDDFMQEADPYSAWQRAVGKYDRRKERWEEQQAAAVTAQTTQATERLQQQYQAHSTRLSAFIATHPDFAQKVQASDAANREMPDLLQRAILEDDNGPAMLYAFASDPVFYDEMHLLSDGRPITESSVAILRRRLNAQLTRTQAAATGSAAAMPTTSWTSRPPNPVRTSPLQTGDDPPGDGHSLAEHAKHYSPKRR
jgi:hypothetical protein